jgi:micrococcal nuclease
MWLLSLFACVPDSLPDWVKDPIPFEGDAPPCAASRFETVACTLDGDTFDVSLCGEDAGGERIRMLGIDAPEIAHDPDPADCYGDEAAAQLNQLLDGEEVLLSFDTECTDIYGRTLAYVWLAESLDPGDTGWENSEDEGGTLVNEWMLENGFARVYDEEFVEPIRLMQRMVDAEALAQSRGLGLWASCDE